MSAPVLWIITPILVGCVISLFLSERLLALAGGLVCGVLAGAALIIPVDQALRIGPLSFKVASSASFLGRSLELPASEGPLLVMVFGLCAFWFIGAASAGVAACLIPLGLIIAGLLVASIAVQPFLYAALLIEMAVLAAVPLLSPPGQLPGPGVIRFLVYQTLAMPFILLAGWLLAGVETSPGDLALTVQSTVMLGLGFAFLLAVFPLSDWIPRLMADGDPYITGFVLWLLPNIIVVFGMSFLDRYAWLRGSPQVVVGLRNIGLMMLMVGGVWYALEDHLGRAMAYTAMAESGFLLLGMSLAAGHGANLTFALLIPRGLGMLVWAFSLSVIKSGGVNLDFAATHGLARAYPWACIGLSLATFSTAGFPLLAGFPPRLALWQNLAHESSGAAAWFCVGIVILMIGAVRQLHLLVVPSEHGETLPGETARQGTMLGLGGLALLVLGVFPSAVGFIVGKMPLIFEHLSK